MNSQELRAAIAVAILFLIRMMGLFAILPVLPLAARELALSTPLLMGIAIGGYGLTQAILQIPLGLLSDRFGRKLIISLGLVVFILGSLVASLSDDIYGVILGRLLQGCGAIASTLLALVADLTRVEHRGKAMAIVGIGIAASFGISLVSGPLIAARGGIHAVFLFSAATGVVGLMVLWWLVPAPLSTSRHLDTGVVTSRLTNVIFNRALIPANVGVLLLHYFLTSSFLVFPALLLGIGIEASAHGGYYFGILLASVLFMSPLILLADRRGRARGVTIGAVVLMTITAAGLVFIDGTVGVLGLMVAFFVAFNLLEVQLPAYLSRVVPAGVRGTGMGVYSSFQFSGTFMGGVVGGFVLSIGDYSMLMCVNAVLGICWIGLSLNLDELSSVESRTLDIARYPSLSANQMLEALSSLRGVLDVVLVETDGVVYLKIDNTSFRESDLLQLENQRIGGSDGTGH